MASARFGRRTAVVNLHTANVGWLVGVCSVLRTNSYNRGYILKECRIESLLSLLHFIARRNGYFPSSLHSFNRSQVITCTLCLISSFEMLASFQFLRFLFLFLSVLIYHLCQSYKINSTEYIHREPPSSFIQNFYPIVVGFSCTNIATSHYSSYYNYVQAKNPIRKFI